METPVLTYREEAEELLSELEISLLDLEENPKDTELIARVFRALHTIKGSGAMFGFDDIAEFTHDVETVFDLVRDSRIPVTKELVDLTLAARDQIKVMLEASDGGESADELKSEEIIAALKIIRRHAGDKPRVDSSIRDVAPGAMIWRAIGGKVTYRIRFQPKSGLFATGSNPILMLNQLRALGDAKITVLAESIPPLEDIDPEACYTGWDITLTTEKDFDDIRDIFIFIEDDCELDIEMIDEGEPEHFESIKHLDEPLLEKSKSREKILLDEEESCSAGYPTARDQAETPNKTRSGLSAASSIRVPAERLDSLVDLVGEIVTVQARLTRKASFQDDAELLSISEEVERLVSELRDNTMHIRMLPIGVTFSSFKRLVRDLSSELGKEVVIETEGGETELDKTVIERLNDPMVHIIRNAVGHGIETPEIREGLGKPRQGVILLTAVHSGANVLIRIRDDGAGLDSESIHAHAVEKGLIDPDVIPGSELFSLIFAPGFTTAADVTGLSGRGVGMDVVKRGIEALGGSIEISSKKGDGTEITLKLPLTLAIIDGLMVRIGDGFFVAPLPVVEECVELNPADLADARRRNLMNFRDEIIPYMSLREHFVISDLLPETEQIVIVEAGEDRIGLGVDHVIGQHQTVIKSLGKAYKDINGLSGATIMGDGAVALILDVNQLVRAFESAA